MEERVARGAGGMALHARYKNNECTSLPSVGEAAACDLEDASGSCSLYACVYRDNVVPSLNQTVAS